MPKTEPKTVAAARKLFTTVAARELLDAQKLYLVARIPFLFEGVPQDAVRIYGLLLLYC